MRVDRNFGGGLSRALAVKQARVEGGRRHVVFPDRRACLRLRQAYLAATIDSKTDGTSGGSRIEACSENGATALVMRDVKSKMHGSEGGADVVRLPWKLQAHSAGHVDFDPAGFENSV